MANRQHVPQPVQEGGGVALFGLDVDGLVTVHGVHERREIELGEVRPREAGVAVRRPLHRRADPVTVAEVDVVAHEQLVAVVEHGAAGQRQQQPVEELGDTAVVVDEGGQAPANAEVLAHPRVSGVLGVHVVALLVGHHLQGELVVVAQEDPPLAPVGDLGGLGEDLGDRETLLAAHGHEHARHEREVEAHVALVAVAEVLGDDVGPLVDLGQEHPVGEGGVDLGTHRRRNLWVWGRLSQLVPSAL